MLDSKTSAVMRVINDLTSDGSYKVIETTDILTKVPLKHRLDKEGLVNVITYLKERDYISVKFSSEEEYCLTSLPKGRTLIESHVEQKRDTHRSFKNFLLISFFGAMLGAFIGSGLFWLIQTLFLS